jgi:hypothetical protein
MPPLKMPDLSAVCYRGVVIFSRAEVEKNAEIEREGGKGWQ